MSQLDTGMAALEAWEINEKLSEMFPFNENTAESQALKCAHEAVEFSDEPSIEEAADVVVTVFQWAIKTGITGHELFHEVYRKTKINTERTWTRKPDGTLQHD